MQIKTKIQKRILSKPRPTSGQHYALEFKVNYAGVTGIAFNLSTLHEHRWSANVDWSEAIAQTDLLTMYDERHPEVDFDKVFVGYGT